MKAEALIGRLDRVKQTGRDQWIACCPAHQDKNPSMTVRELDDGRVLLHCFAGCPVESVLAAVGLDFDALFPDRVVENVKPIRRRFPAADVLEAVSTETLIVTVAAGNLAQGVELSDADRKRLRLAAERINDARSYALG